MLVTLALTLAGCEKPAVSPVRALGPVPSKEAKGPAPAPWAPTLAQQSASTFVLVGRPRAPAGPVEGGFLSNDVERVLAGSRVAFRECYLEGLLVDPAMVGEVELFLKIGPNGEVMTVSAATIKGVSVDVAQCTVKVLRKREFAPPGGGGSSLVFGLLFVRGN